MNKILRYSIIINSHFFFMHTSIMPVDSTTIHNYFWAHYNSLSGNHKSADTVYKQLLTSPSSPIYIYKGYLYFLFETKQYHEIIHLIPLIDLHFENDITVQLLCIRTLEQCRQHKNADDRAIHMSKKIIGHPEITFRAAQAYVKTNELDKALAVTDDYLNKAPRQINNFIFHFLAAQIYILQHKPNEALENVQKCIDMHPQFDQGWLTFATLKEQAGHLEDAIKGYTTFLQITGKNPEIERHIFSLTMKNNAQNISEYASKHPTNGTVSDSLYDAALGYYEQKQYKKALMCINKHLASHDGNTDERAKIFKIDILVTTRRFAQAIKQLLLWCGQEPHKKVWYQTLFLLIHTGASYEKIVRAFEYLECTNSSLQWPPLYLADLAMRRKNSTKATMYLEKVLPNIKKPKLKSKILHYLGLLAFEQGDYVKMEFFLEQAYAQNKTSAPISNDLAYCLIQQNTCNLDRAQSLVTQALQYDNTNPLYIDTQAIIFYKQKKYNEAETLLQPVHTHAQNPTILLNLARIKCELKKHDEARFLAEKAAHYVTLTHENKILEEIRALLAHE